MTDDPRRVRIGEALRQDALGDWQRAERGGTPLCLRILRADLAGREDARMLFEEEIRRIARLDHPALLRVHHVSHKPPRPWMLTDPVDVPSLEDEVAAGRTLPAAEALALARSLLEGCAYLEARSQVHAALVPARLLRLARGWKLATFRDVRAWDELKSLKGKTWAAPGFAPPEQAREHPEPLRPGPYLAWALGGLLRYAAGGSAPRAPDGTAAPLPATFPAALAGPVARLTAWEPEARPAGAPALQRALAGEAAGPAPGAAPRPAAPVPRRRRER